MAYSEREGLDTLLRLADGEPNGTALWYMATYRDLVRRLSWPMAQAWAHLKMPGKAALEAIEKGYVPHELYPLARKCAEDAGLTVVEPPDVPMIEKYEPRADLAIHFRNMSPGMDTPEWEMRLYWEWVHGPFPSKGPEQAWQDIADTFSAYKAWEAIRRRIVPLEIFPRARELALKTGWLPLPVPMVPEMAAAPAPYAPRADFFEYLTTLPAPQRDSGEYQMLIYVQLVKGPPPRTPQQAWTAIAGDLTPQQAYEAIRRRVVPIEIYPAVRQIAAKTNWTLPPP